MPIAANFVDPELRFSFLRYFPFISPPPEYPRKEGNLFNARPKRARFARTHARIAAIWKRTMEMLFSEE